MKNFGIWKKVVSKRSCTCKACKDGITKDTEVMKYYSTIQPKGLTFCIDCYAKRNKEFSGIFTTSNTFGSSKITKNHVIKVRAPFSDYPYFTSKEFDGFTDRNGIATDFFKYCENRFTSGHVVGTALKHNWRVFIDGIEIFSFEDLDAITR